MNMTIEKYGNDITEILKEREPGLEFKFNPEVKKNNGIVLSGITIRDKDSNISPMIYINDLYNRDIEVIDAANEVFNIYNNNNTCRFDFVNNINDFEKVKNNLFIRVVNLEKNQDIINTCPYASFGDLMVYFILIIDDKVDGVATVKVNNDIMNNWGITLPEIMEIAIKNMSKSPAQVIPINVMLNNMLKMNNMTMKDAYGVDELPNDIPLYVVTNNYKNHGCAYIAHKDTLLAVSKQIGSKGFYIIPSSIHEIIVVPLEKSEEQKNTLLEMVKDVNATQVSESEFLSDNVYYFDANTEELTDANDNKLIFLS